MVDLDSLRFEIVLAEAVDRLARKLADIAAFATVLPSPTSVSTPCPLRGDLAMHIGLLGTWRSFYLSDLREDLRGMLGALVRGHPPGGAYGYIVEVTVIERALVANVNQHSEAAVTRRIFEPR
jgi:hypothetical protein